MAVLWRISAFQKNLPDTPIFIVFFGWALFGSRCQKRDFEKPPKKRKIWLITEKLFFGIFAVFFGGGASFFLFFCWFFLEGLRVKWGGPKGHLTWPSTLLICFCCFYCFFVLFFVFCFLFFGFFNTEKTLFSPQQRAFFCLFSVFLFLSPLAFFGLPLFLFLFLCLSLFFFSFFLPSCLSFLLSFGSLFLSLYLFFFLLWFSFMNWTTSQY